MSGYVLAEPVLGKFLVSSFMTAGDTAYFEASDTARIEVFLGTFSPPVTLERTTIISSSNADAAVDWAPGQRIIQMIRSPLSSGSGVIIPLAVGWPAGLNPNNIVLASVNEACTVVAIVGSVEIPTGGAATVTAVKAPSGTAASAGTALHTGSFDANGTAATNQDLTLVGGATDDLAPGDRICLRTTGTTSWTGGAGIGTITVFVSPAA